MLAVDITSSSVRSVDDSDDCQTLEWINNDYGDHFSSVKMNLLQLAVLAVHIMADMQ